MLKVVASLALVSVAYAAVAVYPPQEKPPQFADQEGCYLDSLKLVVPYDQPFYPGNACTSYNCQRSNYTQQFTCGSVQIRPGCTKSADDLTKNYPECCGTEVCDTTTTLAPTTPTSTTPTPTTAAPTTADPTTAAPITTDPTTPAPTTAPTTPASMQTPPPNQGSYASAFAKSGGGEPPVTETYTSGPNAEASATAS